MKVTSIVDGIIIDHVRAGTALKVLHYLRVDPAKTRLALIMNTDSRKYGSKDIIKIEQTGDLDLTALGFIAPEATVDVVRQGRIVSKHQPDRPNHLVNVITCVNPRCVTKVETGVDQRFHLDAAGVYRCDYCDEKAED
ncbi:MULTISPECIES: aspartate carbamoyltransferase regulatory subunit [Bifidobacterium]|uniref:Aspartate carbamoyltransferase regulatory subunit n=1 Tax=Bifidobacterium asteroides TaxID=1684 RepID=A0A556RCB7_9BIFI|nr:MULTISPECIES: aspartate carbamoyltransferase regulatory subunit [Bifidobacterium]MBI0086009.1 aspartate carbamoyltransferase regulatory subunit [Bifidobacterium sp. M0404]TSJ86532.1 aspartate carbamoyltransferase regulatory subunit [Bifidobacterium polysaccharolyticum]